MRAVDTNVVVRLVVGDDDAQRRKVLVMLDKHECWMSHVVLHEVVWVVSSVYGYGHDAVMGVIERLLVHEKLVVEEPLVVQAALSLFKSKPAMGFNDCLVLEVARARGHLPFVTFDRLLGKLPDVERP